MEGGSFGLCDPEDTVDNTVTCNRIADNDVGVVTDTADDTVETNKFQTSPGAPGLWKFSASFKKQNLPGPFLGPTEARLTYGPAIDRAGVVSDCVTSFHKIRCREF
jgi:hypothetical protein